MTITDIIRQRKSIRSYSGIALDSNKRKDIQEYISGLSQPLGGKARIELISSDTGAQPVKLGTYGVISGATDFLVLIYEEGTLAAANAGYLFEQVVLYCTGLGLGTCWLGGTFKKSEFTGSINVKPDELMRIVSPVGYPADKAKFRDKVMRAGAGSNKRKPSRDLFFEGGFDKPLSEGNKYGLPLEMVRLAPSASNSQPWRIVVEGYVVHFYFKQKSYLTDIDMGIALCHFEMTCKELGIKGEFKRMDGANGKDGIYYLISWSEKEI